MSLKRTVDPIVDSRDPLVCIVKECSSPVEALGMCHRHLMRTKRYGSPALTGNHSGIFWGKSAIRRFNLQIKKAKSGCWIWKGGHDCDGYPVLQATVYGQTHHRAHRFIWAWTHKRRIPKGRVVMHLCNNPTCVNPEHLKLGTPEENTKYMIRSGRAPRGEKSGLNKVTNDQVRAIRKDQRHPDVIATEYGICGNSVRNIQQRRTWKHIK
jgi:hypothetical protein